MKHIFIVNPNSGKGKKLNIAERIKTVCEDNILDYQIYIAEREGDALAFAKTLENEDPAIVYAVGGDGTLNEVLNGIAGSCHMLSMVPSGSGNDFYRTLEEYTKERFVCDVGKINDRYFLNIACIGIDAEIADNVSIFRKYPFIPVSKRYSVSIIYTFIKYAFKKLTVTFGTQSVTSFYTIATFCNGRYYGNGYKIAPNASLDDGEMDIYLAEKIPKRKIPGMMKKVKTGQHQEEKCLRVYRDKKLAVDCDKPVICNVDGERLLESHYELEIIPNAITIYKNTELVKAIIGE